MVGKLLRHDLRYLSKVALVVLIVIVAATLVGMLAGYGYYLVDQAQDRFWDSLSNSSSYSDYWSSPEYQRLEALSSVAVLVLALAIAALVAAPFVMLIFSILRFYRNTLTDEGYLTLTLPATSWQVVLSKFLAGFILSTIALLLVLVGGCFIQIGVSGFSDGISDTIVALALNMPDDGLYWEEAITWHVGNIIRNLVFIIISEVILPLAGAFAALVLGARVAVRNKIAAGIGFIILFRFIFQFILGMVLVVAFVGQSGLFAMFDSEYLVLSEVITMVVSAAAAAGFFVWTVYQIRNKLDLA